LETSGFLPIQSYNQSIFHRVSTNKKPKELSVRVTIEAEGIKRRPRESKGEENYERIVD